jgi:hypothetical protein
MKKLLFIAIPLLLSLTFIGDKNIDVLEEVKTKNLSSIFYCDFFETDEPGDLTDRPEPLGFFGNDYHRIFIHFISVIKDSENPLKYYIYGKSRLKGHICEFNGYLLIEKAYQYTMSEFPDKETGFVSGTYILNEDAEVKWTGFFKGDFSSEWMINDEGEYAYNGLMLVADGFSNNQFNGTWTSYTTGKTKNCNWGDFRIPESGDLDGGAGEFFPQEKYWANGWQNYVDAWLGDPDSDKATKAREIEFEEWWK